MLFELKYWWSPNKTRFLLVAMAMLSALLASEVARAGSFAIEAISYSPGTTAASGYTNAAAALGSPERITGEGSFPGVVSPFNPPFLNTELVSIGESGHLTLRLSNYALPLPGGPEIGVFTNVGIADDSFPNGQAGSPPFIFGGGSASVEVSEDGLFWIPLGETLFEVPTNGYQDVAPFSGTPGSVLSNFGQPFTGNLTSFDSLPYDDAVEFDMLELLAGSGGGTWLDISGTGLAKVGYVRFSVADDGDLFTALNFELDAVSLADAAVGAAVPEPSSVFLALTGGAGLAAGGWMRRRRRTASPSRRGARAASLLALALVASVSARNVEAATLLLETFADDPVLAGRATTSGDSGRFTFAPHSATAHYDSLAPTAKLSFPLGKTLTQADDFSFEVDFRILSAGYTANGNVGSQIAFGLTNAATTGNDRAGGATQDAFDVVTFDYFANVSQQFGGPSLGPSVVKSSSGGSFFSHIAFPFSAESDLDAFEGEPSLPHDSLLRAFVGYEANSGVITLSVSEAGVPLEINLLGQSLLPGGFDGDVTTIQNMLAPGFAFAVDQFSLTLWEETFGFSLVDADVVFERIHVIDASVPEPTSLAIAVLGGGLGLVVGLRRKLSGRAC